MGGMWARCSGGSLGSVTFSNGYSSKNFSDARGEIAAVLEQLRQRDEVGKNFPNRHAVVVNLAGVRAQTAQERTAAWIAKRILAVSAAEAHTARRELVHVRRLDQRMAI